MYKLNIGDRLWAYYDNLKWGYLDVLKIDQQFAYTQNSKFEIKSLPNKEVICVSNPEKSTIIYFLEKDGSN